MSNYSETIVNLLLGWLKAAARWVLKLFDLAGGSGSSPLEWMAGNWYRILIFVILAATAVDFFIWMIRWRPYWAWIRKKRIIIHDDNFFAGEKYAELDMYDDSLFEAAVTEPERIRRAEREKRERRRSRDYALIKKAEPAKKPPRPQQEDDLFETDGF